jgi:enoyl-CoA hydratase
MGSVRLTVSEGVAIVELHNPPQNLMTLEMYRQLGEIAAELDQEPEVRSAILCGSGDELFTAGADLKEMLRLEMATRGQRESRAATAYRLLRQVHQSLRRMAASRVPYICAIKGVAYSHGVELAAACDIRVASETAVFAMPELGLGLMPALGGSKRLARLIGPGRLKKWLLTGEALDAAEAYRIGLIDVSCPPGREMLQAHDLGRLIARRPPLAVKSCKQAIDRAWDIPLDEALEVEARLFAGLAATDDALEGVKAFLERREALFRGR